MKNEQKCFFSHVDNHNLKKITVKTSIKRPSYFHLSDEMSLNCELSLNYKTSNFNTFCGVFCFRSLFLPHNLLVFKGCEQGSACKIFSISEILHLAQNVKKNFVSYRSYGHVKFFNLTIFVIQTSGY